MATIQRGVTQAVTISGNSPQIEYYPEGTPSWTGTDYIQGGGNAGGGKGATNYFRKGALLCLISAHRLHNESKSKICTKRHFIP